jgi:hypothetical protein
MLLTLFMSGWSSVFASALCTHHHPAIAPASVEGHASCHAQAAQHEAMHEAMPGMKEERAESLEARSCALERSAETCTHCLSRRELPATTVAASQPGQEQRDSGAAALRVVRQLFQQPLPPAPLVQSKRRAPPGSLIDKHLLLSVFLI